MVVSFKDKIIPGKKPEVPGEKARQPRKPGVADYLTGEAKGFKADLRPYLPGDLVGGSIPQILGAEDEAVWNAAAQACGTERVSYAYTIDEGRCWYLACPSHALASNPDTWCPLAAVLPGGSEHWDKSTVYLYEQEGQAGVLRWDPETGRMQLFLGAARTLLPRIQSMDANFVTVNPESAQIVPWKNRQLNTEKLSRATASGLLYAGLAVNFICVFILIVQYLMTNSVQRDLAQVQQRTEQASTQLMVNAYNALQSDTIKHMVRIQELLDALQKIEATLVKYEVKDGTVTWEALVAPSFSNCTGVLSGCQVSTNLEKDGRVRIKGTH